MVEAMVRKRIDDQYYIAQLIQLVFQQLAHTTACKISLLI